MDTLIEARRIADYVLSRWALPKQREELAQPVSANIAAILVDSVFQAGVNYRSVVFPRVCAVARAFPRLGSLGLMQQAMASQSFWNAVAWKHPEKPQRLRELVDFFCANSVDTIDELREWLRRAENRERLRSVRGVGPKTIDYLSRLVGLPAIAVDRHAQRLLRQVGVASKCYEHNRRVLEFAADLLQISRSLFDHLMWQNLAAV